MSSIGSEHGAKAWRCPVLHDGNRCVPALWQNRGGGGVANERSRVPLQIRAIPLSSAQISVVRGIHEDGTTTLSHPHAGQAGLNS